jgi:prophage regulatory protein
MHAPDQKSFAPIIRLEVAKALTPIESWLKELEAKLGAVTQASNRRLLRAKAVSQKTGLSTSSLYELVSKGTFPKPIKLTDSGRRVAWIESEVDEFIEQRIRIAREKEGPKSKPKAITAKGAR